MFTEDGVTSVTQAKLETHPLVDCLCIYDCCL